MRFLNWRTLTAAVAVTLLGAGLAAQAQRPQDDVLSALLTEVRGLRQAMEQMASAGPRVQLALGRLQLQEQRLNTMLRRLALAQQDLQRWQAEEAQLQQQIAGEQGRWSEINRALEELERALGKR